MKREDRQKREDRNKSLNLDSLNTNIHAILAVMILVLSVWVIIPSINNQQNQITGFLIYNFSQGDSNIQINFSSETAQINPYFYGVNTHGTWASGNSLIDTNDDGISDSQSDYVWHREKLNESKLNYLRADMGLEWLSIKVPNKDAETWTLTNYTLNNQSASKSYTGIPTGWDFEIVGSAAAGTISQSTDSQESLYSVNITNSGTGSAFSNYDLPDLPTSHIYNLSVWVKSNFAVKAHLQRKDTWASPCISYHSGSGSWELLSCQISLTQNVTKGWRIVIETQTNQSLLWDDLSFTQDGQEYQAWSSTIDRHKNLVEWAHNNNIKILYIASYMPTYLANITSDCSSNPTRCPPANYSEWGNLVTSYIDEITNNGEYANAIDIEVWNEPDIGFWLPDLTYTDPKRAILYNNLYNATYQAVKAKYPNMLVGGPALSNINSAAGTMFMESFISSFPNQIDFFSMHTYRDSTLATQVNADIDLIWAKCAEKSADCKKILYDEWNVASSSTKVNNPLLTANLIAQTYSEILNSYPNNISLVMYQWSESRRYLSDISYPEYPQRWSMVSEPSLDNSLYVSYNITKAFAIYHPALSTVVFSNSTNSNIAIVATKENNTYHFTIINKAELQQTISLSIDGLPFTNPILTDLDTGENLSENIILSPLAIKHYGVMESSPAENISEPANETIPSFCGDSTCDANETCSNCNIDCGACPQQPTSSSSGTSITGKAILADTTTSNTTIANKTTPTITTIQPKTEQPKPLPNLLYRYSTATPETKFSLDQLWFTTNNLTPEKITLLAKINNTWQTLYPTSSDQSKIYYISDKPFTQIEIYLGNNSTISYPPETIKPKQNTTLLYLIAALFLLSIIAFIIMLRKHAE